jgi:DNA polymerase III alpha subunit
VVACRGGRLKTRVTHLHVRSGFSYGSGVAMSEELVEVLSRLGMDSPAPTGKNSVQDLLDFSRKAADEHGIYPTAVAETQNGGQRRKGGSNKNPWAS